MSTNDWESLIAQHLDGDASPDEVAKLSEQIESDPELRLLYLTRKSHREKTLGVANS